MTRTEGEHELVLGNKQLLSVFFVVVALMGVFFTMGYFVGKNSATAGFNSGISTSSGGSRPDAAGKAADPSSTTSSTPAPESTTSATDPNTAATSPAPSPSPESSSSTTAAPAPPERTESAPVDSKPAPKSERKPERKPERNEEPATPPERMAQPSSEQMYLQVAAVRKADAENMLKILREHHFPALLGESSKPGLYRVLVGPFKTVSDLGHAKSDLKSKGFDSIVAK